MSEAHILELEEQVKTLSDELLQCQVRMDVYLKGCGLAKYVHGLCLTDAVMQSLELTL